MQFSVLLVFVAVVLGVSAAPAQQTRRQANLNQGSDRPVTKGEDGTFQVDGLSFDNDSLADQVACALDEKDCLASGKSADDCKQQKIGCQSGNALNGQSVLLNNESP